MIGVMRKLFWPLLYMVGCALPTFFLVAGATYWNWEIGAKAAIGGAVMGFLGYLLIRYAPQRSDPRDSFIMTILGNYEAVLGLGTAWRTRAEEAEHLLGRTLMYLAHAPELYHDIQKHFAEVEEANRGREEDN